MGWAGREVGENESRALQGSRVEMTAGPDNMGQSSSGVREVQEPVLGRHGAFLSLSAEKQQALFKRRGRRI